MLVLKIKINFCNRVGTACAAVAVDDASSEQPTTKTGHH